MLRITSFLALMILFSGFAEASTSLPQALGDTLVNSSDLKLEQSRLENVKATKGDAISEFLPDIRLTYQKGRQQNDAVGVDRGDLDDMTDQNVKRLNVSQPLFNGFKGLNKAKEIGYNISQARQYYNSKKDEILLTTVSSYMNLYKNRKLLTLREDSKNNNEKLYRLVKQRNVLGQVGGSEVITYEARLSSSLSEVLNAKKELFKAEEEYQKAVGKVDYDLRLPNTDMGLLPDGEENIVFAVVQENPSLKQYQYKIKASKSSLNQARGQFLPQAEISASMEDQRNVVWLNNGDLKSKSIYLNVSIPIFQSGSEYFGVSKAGKELRFSKREYEVTKENLIKEARQSYKEYLFYKDLLDSDQDLIRLTNERLRKVEKQVDAGQGDIIDFLNVKTELNKVLERQLDNQMEYVLSYHKLLLLVGGLEVKIQSNKSESES